MRPGALGFCTRLAGVVPGAQDSGLIALVPVCFDRPQIARELDYQGRQVRRPVAFCRCVLGPPDPHLAARGVLVPTRATSGCVDQLDPTAIPGLPGADDQVTLATSVLGPSSS